MFLDFAPYGSRSLNSRRSWAAARRWPMPLGPRARRGPTGCTELQTGRHGLSDLGHRGTGDPAPAPRGLLMTCPRRDAFLNKETRSPRRMRDVRSRGVLVGAVRSRRAGRTVGRPDFGFLYFSNNHFRQTETHAINFPMAASISSPRATKSARAAGRRRGPNPHRSDDFISPSKAQERKNGLGGWRNSLETLNSAKEIQGFPLIVFGRAWLDLARFGKIWLWLGKTKLTQASAAAVLSTQADEGVSARRPKGRRDRIRASAPSNAAACALKLGRATP
jgi:hypothetical protein